MAEPTLPIQRAEIPDDNYSKPALRSLTRKGSVRLADEHLRFGGLGVTPHKAVLKQVADELESNTKNYLISVRVLSLSGILSMLLPATVPTVQKCFEKLICGK